MGRGTHEVRLVGHEKAMKFQIIREIKIKGQKIQRKIFAEWDQAQIEEELERQLPGGANALRKIVAKFKKKTISIP